MTIDMDLGILRKEIEGILRTQINHQADLDQALNELDYLLSDLEGELPFRFSVAELRQDLDGSWKTIETLRPP